MTLAVSPTVIATSASRVTSTAASAVGLGASLGSTSASQSLNITLKYLSGV